MQIDVSFLPTFAAAFLLCFARIGTMVMLLPGLGELSVPPRVRLTAFGPVLLVLGQELMVGAVLGLVARLTISALQIAGSAAANQMGLGFVTAIDPTLGQQGIILGNFLSILGVTLIFAADLHHLVIAALNDSYTLFRPGELPVMGDVAQLMTGTVASAFRIGVQLAAPFLAFGLLFNLGLGVLSRLMPQMPVYFVGMPASIMAGFLILLLVVGGMMAVFLGHLEGVLRTLAPNN